MEITLEKQRPTQAKVPVWGTHSRTSGAEPCLAYPAGREFQDQHIYRGQWAPTDDKPRESTQRGFTLICPLSFWIRARPGHPRQGVSFSQGMSHYRGSTGTSMGGKLICPPRSWHQRMARLRKEQKKKLERQRLDFIRSNSRRSRSQLHRPQNRTQKNGCPETSCPGPNETSKATGRTPEPLDIRAGASLSNSGDLLREKRSTPPHATTSPPADPSPSG